MRIIEQRRIFKRRVALALGAQRASLQPPVSRVARRVQLQLHTASSQGLRQNLQLKDVESLFVQRALLVNHLVHAPNVTKTQ